MMKKISMGLFSAAFLLGSIGVASAGPNVGGKNYGPQGRDLVRKHNDSLERAYGLTGEAKLAETKWEWNPRPRNNFRGSQSGAFKRVPAN